VVDSGVEPELIADIGAFCGASSNPDGPRARDPGKLAHEGPDRPTRRGHNDRLACFGLTDYFHAGICCEARHAENAKRGCGGIAARFDAPHGFGGHGGVRTPADPPLYEVTLAIAGMSATPESRRSPPLP
jgi:hypothetical protein